MTQCRSLAVALEERMLLHVQHDVKIAGRAVVNSGFAFAGVENARAFLDARGNFHGHGSLALDAALSLALLARIDDQLARATAGAAGARHREEALLITHLSASAAGGAVDGRLAGGCAASLAVVAGFQAADLHLPGHAEDRFFEFQREVLAHVGAALRLRTPALSLAKHVAKPEQVAEDILEIVEDGGVESAAAGTIAGNAGMTEAVIARALLGVGEHRVGLAAFLEFLFRLGIAGIAVGMDTAARACDRSS